MILSLMRKHAALLAALAALMAAFAAPYLLPADPDSAVFRSGALGALLLLAAYRPVHHALAHRSLRQLAYGCVFGFIFALCLGVGSELAYYDQLLPGLGSLLRRAAVPMMITPLFGALASYVFSFSPAEQEKAKAKKPIPYIAFFLLFALCYGAVMLAFYPGVVSYDFEHEIRQYQSGVFEAAHPVFHTLFLGALYQLGETLFGSMTAGAAAYSVVQLLLLAAMYAWACTFVQRRLPLPLTLLLTACFAFLPFHGVMAISTAKDPLFAGLCVILCLLLWEIAENPDAFLASRFKPIRFTLCCLLLALLRRNGVFAFLPACIALTALCRRQAKRTLPVLTFTLALCFLAPNGLDALVGAQSAPSSEMMSVPCQQLMRTAARADLPEEEYAEISAWFSDAIHRYRPHCADPAKGGNFDFARYQEDPSAFWKMYIRYAKKYPRIYIEAFLENCAGLWNPDDISHATALAGEDYDFVYLITDYMYEEGRYDIHPHSLLTGLRSLIYDFTHHNAGQDTLFLSQLFCPATYTFLMLLGAMALSCKRRGKFALCMLPLWGIFLSLLFSAGIFIRYAYPIMAATPLLFALALYAKPSDC